MNSCFIYHSYKNRFLNFLFFIILFFSIGCTKTPINGHLDGEWEVMEVYPTSSEWNKDSRIFYNFQLHVCQLTFSGGPFTEGNLYYTGNSMTLNFPYIKTEAEEIQLKQYGIFTNPVSFDVQFEGKRGMILSNDDVIITLRKF